MFNNQAPKYPQPAARQPYVTPQLVAYGLVRELTAGGSNHVQNESMVGGMNQAKNRI